MASVGKRIKNPPRRAVRNYVGLLAAFAIGAACAGLWFCGASASSARHAAAELSPGRSPAPAGFPADALVGMPEPELARLDPVIVNLSLAKEIPAFSNLDIPSYAQAIDSWAAEIRQDTERHRYRFEKDPAQFKDSEIEYKLTWLVSDIDAVFHIDYDLADLDFRDPSNLFLNGIVDRQKGTCVSMPLLYLALGWRLGYSIKLVNVPLHCFARWDDGVNRINLEATGYGQTQPDEYYEGRYFVSPECKTRGGYLASLTAKQTLAMMFLSRASYWQAQGDTKREIEDALRARLLYPDSPLAVATLADALQRQGEADPYYRQAPDSLRGAARKIAERDEAERGKPIERLLFTESGPKRVLVDPATGMEIGAPASKEIVP